MGGEREEEGKSEGGPPKAPTASSAHARREPAWGLRVGEAGLQAPGPSATTDPQARPARLRDPALRPRAPRRPIVPPARYSPPGCPASPWCWAERTVRCRERPGQRSGRSGRSRDLLSMPHPAQRAAPRGPYGRFWPQRHLSARRRGQRRRPPIPLLHHPPGTGSLCSLLHQDSSPPFGIALSDAGVRHLKACAFLINSHWLWRGEGELRSGITGNL